MRVWVSVPPRVGLARWGNTKYVGGGGGSGVLGLCLFNMAVYVQGPLFLSSGYGWWRECGLFVVGSDALFGAGFTGRPWYASTWRARCGILSTMIFMCSRLVCSLGLVGSCMCV